MELGRLSNFSARARRDGDARTLVPVKDAAGRRVAAYARIDPRSDAIRAYRWYRLTVRVVVAPSGATTRLVPIAVVTRRLTDPSGVLAEMCPAALGAGLVPASLA